jgi:hypothetical protein
MGGTPNAIQFFRIAWKSHGNRDGKLERSPLPIVGEGQG